MTNHEKFSKKWIESWNKHDLDAILSHYDEDMEFHSPFITKLNFNSSGMITSKQELRDYFTIGLNTYPDLNFKLIKVLSGINSLVICYESVNNKIAAEVFFLNSKQKATKVFCHYV